MIRKQITLLACLLYISISFAQTHKQRIQSISLEIGKTGLIYNLNYDYKLPNNNIGFRVGIGSNLGQYVQLFSFGGGSYYLFGSKQKFFELGGELHYLTVVEISNDQRSFADIFIFPNDPVKTFYASLNAGYRQSRKKTLFRAGIAPGFYKNGFIPGAYVSFGISF